MADLPIIRSKVLSGGNLLNVMAGLNWLKGNKHPYFSLTGEIIRSGIVQSCGMLHDDILREWPGLSDLAALHMSNEDGWPMYAAENGAHWAGFGALRYGGAKIENCASLWRVSLAQAQRVVEVARAAARAGESDGERLTEAQDYTRGAAEIARWCETQRARWSDEAASAVRRYSLQTVRG